MANDQIRDLHLFAMESVLPVGIGIVRKVRSGGLPKIMKTLKSKDPLSEFLVDGESSAKTLRDQIDQLIPGLGHPVVSVDVSVDNNYSDYEVNDRDSLISTLDRIDAQLDQLRHYLNNDSKSLDDT
tara:strand:+ start:230 stop:607 length:378 start_codon:yes stop_codon:yes gene_type:complete